MLITVSSVPLENWKYHKLMIIISALVLIT